MDYISGAKLDAIIELLVGIKDSLEKLNKLAEKESSPPPQKKDLNAELKRLEKIGIGDLPE